MKLNNSPKVYKNIKCDYPNRTIQRIEDGFKKIGLKIDYKEEIVNIEEFSIVLGNAYIDILGWGQYGKATSRELAKAGAYAELAERYSTRFMEFKIPLPENPEKYQKLLHRADSRSFLKGYVKVENHEATTYEHINKYFFKEISKEQYNFFKKEHLFDVLVDSYSLINKKYEKIPIFFVELNSTSNGLAAGNTFEEAIVQASFEIFERYALIKVMSEKLSCPTIKPETIKNTIIQKCIRLLKSFNIEVLIKDFTLNNSVPVIGVLFINKNLENTKNKLRKNRDYKRISAGSNFNLEEAIIRCFTEHLQMLVLDNKGLPGRKQDRSISLDDLYDLWINNLGKDYTKPDEEFKYLLRDYDYYEDYSFLENGEKKSFEEINFPINNDYYEDTKAIIDICKNNNWDISIIDYTNKLIQFPVARVIIPPISSDFNPYNRKLMLSNSFEERINLYYGIKDFCKYIIKDNWINDKDAIKKLIKNIEEYLSKELCYYNIYVRREDSFLQIVNLFTILPFLHLAIGNYEESKKYLSLASKFVLKNSSSKKSNKTNCYVSNYKKYTNMINNSLDKNEELYFKLTSNPFDYEKINKDLENVYLSLFEKIGASF